MASTSAVSAASNLQAAGMGLEDLMKILLTQLTYQDPLKPMDNQEFVAQIAQFSALEANRQLNDKFDNLLSIQSSVQSIGLLGRQVDLAAPTGSVNGQVTALTFKEGEPVLTVKTPAGAFVSDVRLSQIISIR
ncbi:flagellar hook assembly protein FlgD [Chitinimonas lacunae]|uniref:Basal-body rod modification protein FlgD n=1 Tax=Chitinimonas lacunae TaxID=1963018 RepID=A0ABV8MW25_9NEIS